jgi:hypothetical protein
VANAEVGFRLLADMLWVQSMIIRKSVKRVSEKIMLKQQPKVR